MLRPFPKARINGIGSVINAYNEDIIKVIIEEKNLKINRKIGSLSELKNAGILMVIIKANSNNTKCELQIKQTMNEFEDLISDSDMTC